MGKAPPHFQLNVAETFHSQRQDVRSASEGIRSRFYEDYRKVAREYDEEFDKKYDEDLNTTLIFVSLVSCSDTHGLTRITGWSVLRRYFRFHHRGQPPAPVRPKRRNGRSPSRPHPQD